MLVMHIVRTYLLTLHVHAVLLLVVSLLPCAILNPFSYFVVVVVVVVVHRYYLLMIRMMMISYHHHIHYYYYYHPPRTIYVTVRVVLIVMVRPTWDYLDEMAAMAAMLQFHVDSRILLYHRHHHRPSY